MRNYMIAWLTNICEDADINFSIGNNKTVRIAGIMMFWEAGDLQISNVYRSVRGKMVDTGRVEPDLAITESGRRDIYRKAISLDDSWQPGNVIGMLM
jgi:hypothetical protein